MRQIKSKSTGGAREGAGRPPGRANVATVHMKATLSELAREHTEAALETILTVMRSGETDAIKLAAANIILDRGYGKPTAAVEIASNTSNLMTLDEAQSRTQRAVLAILEARHAREDD